MEDVSNRVNDIFVDILDHFQDEHNIESNHDMKDSQWASVEIETIKQSYIEGSLDQKSLFTLLDSIHSALDL